MAFTGAAGTRGQHAHFLLNKAALCKLSYARLVNVGVKVEVEAFQRFVAMEAGPAQAQGVLLLFTAFRFVLNDQT